MKRIILATAVALTLTACATNQDAYYNAIAAREARQAEQELRADTAIAQMAASGDAQAKGMALMHFAMKANSVKQNQQAIAAPKSVADQLLPWASLIVPSITQFYSITKNAEIAINSSNNALAGKVDDNDMVTDLVQGRGPIVGTQDDVLLYPFPPAVTP
jgi:protein involved in sex pheromone biosynthesis